MTLWFVFALMTAAAVFAVLWPLARRKPLRRGSDVEVYRDQLDEIARDRSAGLIGEAEAEAARVEVSRRLIAAADAAAAENTAPEAPAHWRRRVTALAGLVLLPVGAVLLYLMLGSPELPGQPLAARLQAPNDNRSIENLVAQVEKHVERNPNDGRAWEVLAPVYMRLGRFDDAVKAWRNVISLSGSNAERESDFGEAVVAAANGVVTAEAKAAFERALALDRQDVMARFYMGMAADQDGRRADAEKIWNDLLASAPRDAPWVEVVRHAMERNAPGGTAVSASGATGGSTSAGSNTLASAQPPSEHNIDEMIARLAARLRKDGSDVNGWVQLVRSYRAIGQNDKAQTAIADARNALVNDPDKLRQFTEGTDGASPTAPAVSADNAQAAQMPAQDQNQMIANMVERLAARLKKDGSDVDGWIQLVRSYRVLGEFSKAEAAATDARNALANNPDKLRQFAEASDRSASAAPVVPAPPAAPAVAAPGPSASDIAAAANMKPDEQNQMIRGMVARLADRLKQDGSDVAGWERLLRAYMVLGESDKAHAAATDARRALAGDPDKLHRLEEVIKDLKVED